MSFEQQNKIEDRDSIQPDPKEQEALKSQWAEVKWNKLYSNWQEVWSFDANTKDVDYKNLWRAWLWIKIENNDWSTEYLRLTQVDWVVPWSPSDFEQRPQRSALMDMWPWTRYAIVRKNK